MTDLADFARLIPGDHGLCVVSTLRTDGTIQSSVVNAGVLPHPITQREVIGFVARGGTRKLANLRTRPYLNIVVRSGWQWAAAEGPVQLAGPDDPLPGIDAEALASYCAPSSPRQAAPTTTGTPTTRSWPTNTAQQCSSPPTGPTPPADRTRLRSWWSGLF